MYNICYYGNVVNCKYNVYCVMTKHVTTKGLLQL